MFKEGFKRNIPMLVFFFISSVFALCEQKCNKPSHWLPVAQNVCHGTKLNAFGKFKMNRDCKLVAIRLSHVSGYQLYGKTDPTKGTRWGINTDSSWITTIILKNNKRWLPNKINSYGHYRLKGFGKNDDVIAFKKEANLTIGEEFQIGTGRDFRNYSEKKSDGTHCVDVDVSCFE